MHDLVAESGQVQAEAAVVEYRFGIVIGSVTYLCLCVHLSVGQLVSPSVGWLVSCSCHYFKKGR